MTMSIRTLTHSSTSVVGLLALVQMTKLRCAWRMTMQMSLLSARLQPRMDSIRIRAQSEEQAVDLMGTKAPADLHGIGKDKRIGTTRPAITKNILTWRLAKLEEEKPAVVAEVLKIAKGSVAKYAGRGAWACELGRQRLVRPEFTPEGLDSEALRLADDLDFLALRAANKARGGAQ